MKFLFSYLIRRYDAILLINLMMKMITPVDMSPVVPSIKQAFLYWLKLGFTSFGGPAGQIAIMHHDLVENKRWISEKRFLHALNYCMVLPGPEAQQLAIYIGWLMHRTMGGVIAGSLFVLPSLIILMALSFIYIKFGNLPAIASVLYGIKPAIVAIVIFAAYKIGSKTIKNKVLFLISALSFFGITVFKLPFPLIVFSALIVGFLVNRFYPSLSVNSGYAASDKRYGKAIIDDDTPTPYHANFNWQRLFRILIVGLLIWTCAMSGLTLIYGWTAIYTQMAWFFTKAALLTFGGAYAVLPYVYQGAVTHFQWLTPAQMMDGLALGETTPGPLIMVVAFVGFVGGWTHDVIQNPVLSAILAATIVTFFTFLPSFILIFVGAPFIESTQQNLNFTAPLAAISAAVVGVIVSLALFFAQHIIFPNGLEGNIDMASVLAIFVAGVLMFKFKPNIMLLIALFAGFGLLYGFVLS
jgi:chromate transporter